MKQTDLTKRIGDLQVLVGEIDSQRSWQLALAEIENQIDVLDSNWQSVTKEKFYEMQVTKIGLMSVLNLVDEWKEELAGLLEELEAEEHPDKVQQGDYDNELIEEEK